MRTMYICPRCRGTCRCGRKRPASTTLVSPAALLGLAIAYPVLFWPWFVWHGYNVNTGNGWGWRWDTASTVGCCTWWLILLLVIGFIFWAGRQADDSR
jgi:hypothetical protein